MSRVPRVVLDTNLVLSALVFAHGRVAALRDAWKNSVFEPLISTPTADELIRELVYPKFKLDPAEQNELLADYLPWCRTVSIPDKPPRTPPCRDPFDIPFLQLAVVGKADFLATGDADLLSIKAKTGFRIVTAEALLAALI
jgi:putative PIN family toxin of toxin-antitoxin system